jgi:hypothetical protein
MSLRTQNLLTYFLIGVFAYAVIGVWGMPLEANLFPKAIGILALVLLVWQLYMEMQPEGSKSKKKKEAGNVADFGFTEEEALAPAKRKTIEMFGWIFGFGLALWLLGFHIAVPLMILLFLVRHRQSWTLTLSVTLVAGIVLWSVFDFLLHLPFPPGKLFDWLSGPPAI